MKVHLRAIHQKLLLRTMWAVCQKATCGLQAVPAAAKALRGLCIRCSVRLSNPAAVDTLISHAHTALQASATSPGPPSGAVHSCLFCSSHNTLPVCCLLHIVQLLYLILLLPLPLLLSLPLTPPLAPALAPDTSGLPVAV